MSTSQAPKEDKVPKDKELRIKIHNEDDGENAHFDAKPHDKLDSVIDRFYSDDLGRERRQDDRLRCRKGGEDVFGFAEQTFKQYLAEGHCPELHWLFAGGTGGA
jgi:hypothetical protein